MKAKLEGAELLIAAEKGDPWKGETLAHSVVEHPHHGPMLSCGRVKVGGKQQTLCLKLATRPALAAVVREWEAAKDAEEKAEEAAAAATRTRIETGDDLIEVSYCDGEYLGGYEAFGYGGELLIRLGLAKHVDGWGVHVNHDVVSALGKSFSYPVAAEYARPALEAAKEKKAAKEKARAEKVETARQMALETGRPAELDRWTETRRDNSEGEWGDYLFIVTRYIRADGSMFTKAINTY